MAALTEYEEAQNRYENFVYITNLKTDGPTTERRAYTWIHGLFEPTVQRRKQTVSN